MQDEIVVRIAGPEDLALILGQDDGLFDFAPDPDQTAAFLASPLSEMAIAQQGPRLLAFASGNILLHPDKPPSMFVNEVGTREAWQRRGLARRVTGALFFRAREKGCKGIWLGTEPDNAPACALYRMLGGDERAIAGFGWDGAFELD